jgi:hypothetical protein
MRKKYRLNALERKVLIRILGYKGNKVIKGWRKLYNEEIRNWHLSSNVIRVIKARHVAGMGRTRKAYKTLV